MKMPELHIAGNIHTDEVYLKDFSSDASSYRIRPQMVIEPANEDDVLKVVAYARKNGMSITCRSGGSGLSGAGIGEGIILNFKALMNGIRFTDQEVTAQPGAILDYFLKRISDRGLMLPAVPSSSAWCALGGNIGTRSTGPRTARYGTIDAFVSSLRFISSGGVVVDTSEDLPAFLEEGLMEIRKRYLEDRKGRKLFEGRPFIAGGYNIKAFSRYQDPCELATHLLVGSIGTLGIVTEIRFRLLPQQPAKGSYAAFFSNIDDLGAAIKEIKDLCPAGVEFVDKTTMVHVRGQYLNAEDHGVEGALLVEFDESREQVEKGKTLLESFDLKRLVSIPADSEAQTGLWEERRSILPSLRSYAGRKKLILPSIIDDIAIHLDDFAPVFRDLRKLMADLGLEFPVFGHIGFGSLHARPFFDPRDGDIVKQVMAVSRETFRVLKKYGGTLVGEHNAGRSRSVYLKMELGECFSYLRDVKDLFDPEDLLNPSTMFDLAPITENMDLSL